MNRPAPTRQEYLERLRDLLPAREGVRVAADVESLILDHIEAAERDGKSAEEAERGALAALGTPEVLADRLAAHPLQIGSATRRSLARWLAVLFAGHLLLSIVLTVAGVEGPVLPGLLGPLPRAPVVAFFAGLVGVFLVDVGLVVTVFALQGALRRPSLVPAFPRLRPAWGPRDSVLALVGLAAVAVVFNPPVRDVLFAVRHQGRVHPLVAPDLLAIVPCVNGILALHALRNAWLLLRRRLDAVAVALDVLATLATVALLVLAVTRGSFIQLPGSVDEETARLLVDLATRGLLLLFVLAAFFLAVRGVRRLMLLRQLLAA